MSNKSDRKALVEQYKQIKEDAGVYRIVNNNTGQYLLGSTTNMRSILSKYQFAKNTGTATVWLQPLAEDIKQHGYDRFSLEVLELLDIKPETTTEQIKDGIETLEAICRDKLDPSKEYGFTASLSI